MTVRTLPVTKFSSLDEAQQRRALEEVRLMTLGRMRVGDRKIAKRMFKESGFHQLIDDKGDFMGIYSTVRAELWAEGEYHLVDENYNCGSLQELVNVVLAPRVTS